MSPTIPELLNTASADAPALLAPGRPALDYAGLRGQCRRIVAALNALGVGRGDRVGIVLLRPGERLAPYKVPEKVVFVREIPKGATGKLQRIGLAAKLGLGE